MNIYPAIDIQSKQCVRLYQGDYSKATVYGNDPIQMAQTFKHQGAHYLHIVDLDGAKQGKPIHTDLITTICQETGLRVQTGGGVRTAQHIDHLLGQGVDRIVIGSIAIEQPQILKTWLQDFGAEKIVLALDIRIDNAALPRLNFNGWQSISEKNLWQLLDEYQDFEIKHVLCTDIQQDGALSGPNLDLYRECVRRYPSIIFQASGGIRHVEDLSALSSFSIGGAVIGKALYENKISLSDALSQVKLC